ncbi:hypothetical protein HBA55_18395 [Pseudomaricurvus alkylphenolicus]|uniref:MFS transporter n=1 Tax=Pseudomaricurvus alkylphenolicus TaxID=1306991 RepID=UPI0014225657|nr:MFS transporter [Pseudomaricurvus alkylphenolicus]NIB41580.1 hypothetical protein [Pseudomaricurvus alkylphenolicus]
MGLNKRSLAALSAPGVPMFALMMPLVIFIPPYYAEHMGLGMATVGTLFTLGRLFDVVTDPFAGVLMDKTRKFIPKQGWITLGAIPLSLAIWNIFFAEPPGDPTTLMIWILVLYAAWTLMSVGLFSWGSEVARNYHERSVVMGAIQIANLSGTVLVLVIPAVIEFFVNTDDVQLLRIRAMGFAILLLLPIALIINWLFAPRPDRHLQAPGESVLSSLKGAFANPSFRRLILADLCIGLILGTQTAIIVFYVEIVLNLQGRAAILQLLTLVMSVIGLPLFLHLARKWEKHDLLSIAVCCTAIVAVIASQAPAGSLYFAMACYMLYGLPIGAAQMLPRSIMSDVLDETRQSSGDAQTGLYFAFLSTTFKLGMGLGVGVTYLIAAVAGFDPITARMDDSAHWVIRTMVGVLPAALALIVTMAMWQFPLNRKRCEDIYGDTAGH